MASSRLECVADASVLIDLNDGRVLDVLSGMSDRFYVPDVVVAELDEPDGATLRRAGLRPESLPGEAVVEVMRLTREERRISVEDASALVLAETTRRVLLTGDRRLRELAQKRGVAVHGTLWLLERMVAEGALTRRRAAEALEKMLECDRRLPESEARSLIHRWRAAKEGA
jgi:predicted nucleic acid-binding protein